MCGFTGCVSFNKINYENVQKSNEYSICRGPDNTSSLIDTKNINSALWFNRLSIQDLSDKANQPMETKDNNYVLMFNGEIYNNSELRNSEELKNYNFRTSHSDTETLLAGLKTFGISFITKLEGQFSFFYLDKNCKKIYLAKDRLGQKPLYYNIDNNTLNFASDLRSILCLLDKPEISVPNLNEYLSYGVISTPNTIFKNINKLEPATYLEINYSNSLLNKKTFKYWDLKSFIDYKKFNQEEFLDIFSSSVNKRLISDVPISCFLSGGLDSSSIVKNLYDNNVQANTFSAVVEEEKLNEKKYIDQVVKKYSTKHIEEKIDSNISTDQIFEALSCLDEPYGDPSVVPTYIISKIISKNFKVALSGDGGDELLGGYERMKNHLIKRHKINKLFDFAYYIYPGVFGSGNRLLSKSINLELSYRSNLEDYKFLKNIQKFNTAFSDKLKLDKDLDIYKAIVLNEYNFYLAEQMLFKIDRASMANSLEVRSPFVDNKLVEYIFSHSSQYLDNKINKKPLTEYLRSDFDKEFLFRSKQGFVFDYKNWVFNNKKIIKEIIYSSILCNFIDLEFFEKLFIYKTRINSLRIWRILVLANYFERTKVS